MTSGGFGGLRKTLSPPCLNGGIEEKRELRGLLSIIVVLNLKKNMYLDLF